MLQSPNPFTVQSSFLQRPSLAVDAWEQPERLRLKIEGWIDNQHQGPVCSEHTLKAQVAVANAVIGEGQQRSADMILAQDKLAFVVVVAVVAVGIEDVIARGADSTFVAGLALEPVDDII